MVGGANAINGALYNVGQAESNLANGAGSIIANTGNGVGGTLAALPTGAYRAVGNLQRGNGLIQQPLNMLVGGPSQGRRHGRRQGPYGYRPQGPYGGRRQGPYGGPPQRYHQGGPPRRYHQDPPRGHPIRRIQYRRQYQ